MSKQIDLPPDDYRVRDPKSGRWFQRDDKRFLAGGLIVDLVIIGFIWWNRGEVDPNTLFWATTVAAAGAGGFFALLTKDIY